MIRNADIPPRKIKFDVAIMEINISDAEHYKSALTEFGNGLFYNYDSKQGTIVPGGDIPGQFWE